MLFALVVVTGCPGGEEQPPVADGDDTDTEPSSDTSSGGGSADDTETGPDTGGEQCVEEPTDPVGLLNGCTDATCEPFANTPERLPRLEADGTLPPLP